MTHPRHHLPGRAGFTNPWAHDFDPRDGSRFWKWRLERLRKRLPPNPRTHELRNGTPRIARPHAALGDVRVTWVGQATFLLQIGGANVLTDPVWSRRVSPVTWVGPRRLRPPGIRFDALPDIDVVLVSHDHFDHLDAPTVRRLSRRYPEARWLAPLGHAEWLARRGVRLVEELDWWEERDAARGVTARALPAQHWCSRGPLGGGPRLWCSWALRTASGRAVYFGGDSGYFPGYREIAAAAGPFDVLLLPIGAYEPRWFMKPAHMNPEDAVSAYRDLGERGIVVPMHWGTFRLSDEHPLEPAERMRAAWEAEALPADNLRILLPGETLCV